MAEPLRFGIIGCGVIGPTHAEAIAGLDDARLVAVVDRDAERARTLGQRYGAEPLTGIQEMLERARPDIVCICTPSGMHGTHACQAMRAGAHVIVEKPMEISHAAIDSMLRVQEETGRKLAVISQHRFDPASQQVRALVEEGAFGKLVLANAHILWWRSQGYYDSGAWRGTWELDGGGVLMNQSIHSIDLLTWLAGPVRSIHARTGTLVHRMETEDAAAAALRFASGTLGTIAATTGAYPGVTTRVELFGDGGSAIIENDRLGYLHLARDDAGKEVGPYGANHAAQSKGAGATAANPAALSATTHAKQIADMIRAVREDGTPLLDGRHARHAVDVILGIYESARTGKEVLLP
jgi:predicted dehydrogenase